MKLLPDLWYFHNAYETHFSLTVFPLFFFLLFVTCYSFYAKFLNLNFQLSVKYNICGNAWNFEMTWTFQRFQIRMVIYLIDANIFNSSNEILIFHIQITWFVFLTQKWFVSDLYLDTFQFSFHQFIANSGNRLYSESPWKSLYLSSHHSITEKFF